MTAMASRVRLRVGCNVFSEPGEHVEGCRGGEGMSVVVWFRRRGKRGKERGSEGCKPLAVDAKEERNSLRTQLNCGAFKGEREEEDRFRPGRHRVTMANGIEEEGGAVVGATREVGLS